MIIKIIMITILGKSIQQLLKSAIVNLFPLLRFTQNKSRAAIATLLLISQPLLRMFGRRVPIHEQSLLLGWIHAL